MTAIIMREKSHELKGILCKAMELVEEMCEDEMGERGGYNYGNRNMDYPYGDRMGMREHHYPMMQDPWYGERRGVHGTGRYSMYR